MQEIKTSNIQTYLQVSKGSKHVGQKISTYF